MAPAPIEDRRPQRARVAALAVAVVGAAVPLLRALPLVRDSSRMQHSDYWPMLDTMLGDDGGLRWAGLLEARNQHPVVIPKAIYWLNVLAADGDNRTLGLVTLGIVAATVVLVGLIARTTPGLGRGSRVSLTISASVLLFAHQGAWGIVKAMSGTAWFTANAFAVAAVLAAQRGRRVAPAVLAVLATISYGTGLAAWPAVGVVLIASARSRRDLVRHWPTAVAGTVSLGLYGAWYSSRPFPGPPRPGPLALGERVLTGLGSLPGDGRAPVALGLLAVALGAVALAVAWRRRLLAAAAPWLGFVAYGGSSLVLIATSRTDSTASRYTSLAALTWLGVVGLVLVALPRRGWTALVPIPLVVAVGLGGNQTVQDIRPATAGADLLAGRILSGVADGSTTGGERHPFPAITERLRVRGHHPFTSDRVDCGLMGRTVDVGSRLPSTRAAVILATEDRLLQGWGMSRGWVLPGGDVECALVVDGDDRVIGAGPTRAGDHGRVFFTVVSPLAPERRVVIRFAGDDRLYPVPADPP